MLEFNEIKGVYVHDGPIHADDACVVGFLREAKGNALKVKRSDTPPKNAERAGFLVADVGGGEFDHHSLPRECRKNGVPYAAFGKVVRAYGLESGLLKSKAHLRLFDSSFVQDLDLYDNEGPKAFNGRMQGFCQVIDRLNPMWDEDQSKSAQYGAFMVAVSVAQRVIRRELRRVESVLKANSEVRKLVGKAENHVLVLSKYMHFQAALAETDIKWVICPSQRGGYSAMPVKNKDGNNRQLWPEEYRGKAKTELLKLCPGMTFCHPTGFMAVFESEDAARSAAEKLARDE